MNAYLIHLITLERKKREKLYKMQQMQQMQKTKQMNRNINGPDDINYSMAGALDNANVDMYDLIHSIKRNFWK